MPFLKSLKLEGILSFPPGSEAIPLTPLNVLIGPNGSGKSNLIEGIELLHALPTGFASAIRQGGGVREWLWKGAAGFDTGFIEVEVDLEPRLQRASPREMTEAPAMLASETHQFLRYALSFAEVGQRVELLGEVVEASPLVYGDNPANHVIYYQFLHGVGVVNAIGNKADNSTAEAHARVQRYFDRNALKAHESILAQLRDPFVYPELTELGRRFEAVETFREWSFGRDSAVRKPQPTDRPSDVLLADSSNLGLVLNKLEHSGAWSEFNGYLSRFLPRFERFSTRIEGGTVQFYLHESGMRAPIPATRLSDGTIRFMAILAQLLSPTPPPLICMEEPELGLHPDAIALLASLLQEASTRTQLIVTTHSDILISALTEVADSVLVCDYRNGTVMRRVESSQLRFWLDKYTLGEIWRIGEIGGNL